MASNFEFNQILKPHIFFYSNDLAIWNGLPDITHIKDIYADSPPF